MKEVHCRKNELDLESFYPTDTKFLFIDNWRTF